MRLHLLLILGLTLIINLTPNPYLMIVMALADNHCTPTAAVSGSPTPQLSSTTEVLVNEGFKIYPLGQDVLLGDGINELTAWAFNFADIPKQFRRLNPKQLRSVKLTLKLILKDSEDFVSIDGFEGIVVPQPGKTLPLNEWHTVELELLNFYDAQEIIDTLFASPTGRLSMGYEDDAIISVAILRLTIDDCEQEGAVNISSA